MINTLSIMLIDDNVIDLFLNKNLLRLKSWLIKQQNLNMRMMLFSILKVHRRQTGLI